MFFQFLRLFCAALTVKICEISDIFRHLAPLCRSGPFGGTSRSFQASWSFRHTSSTWSANWHLSCSNGGRWDIRLPVCFACFASCDLCGIGQGAITIDYVPFLLTVENLKHVTGSFLDMERMSQKHSLYLHCGTSGHSYLALEI